MDPSPSMRRGVKGAKPADVAVVAFDGARAASVHLFLDAFDIVRHHVGKSIGKRDTTGMATQVRLLSAGRLSIRAAGGRKLTADGNLQDTAFSLIHVPDFHLDDPEEAGHVGADQKLLDWLAVQHGSGAILSATGAGIFLLARAGVLGRGPIALAPALAPMFHRLYPGVQIDRRSALVDFNGIVTCAGLASELRLLVHLVERLMSPASAGALAIATGMEALGNTGLSDDPLIASAQIWLAENYASASQVSALADHLAVSQATLLRRFRAKLGTTPRAYTQMLRMRSAQAQLRKTDRSIGQIATLVGYDDPKSFREAFRTCTGMSARQYRDEARHSVRHDISVLQHDVTD